VAVLRAGNFVSCEDGGQATLTGVDVHVDDDDDDGSPQLGERERSSLAAPSRAVSCDRGGIG
jgi:hypothetical protein